MKNKRKLFLAMLVLIFFTGLSQLQSQQLAFPTAEGYGKYVTGGRGGKVYEVTNLNSSGSGSFGEAISASGARTVVFRVSGTITGNFNISNGDITIAGQTAPGDGICIKGNLSTSADNIIIRYIRVRFDPSTGENDAIGGRFQKNIIIDHVSASWSADEVFSLYHNDNTTVQWCIIAEGCEKPGEGHRFGGIWGNNYGTWHHNLIAHNDNRNPRWASGCGYNDYRNNVVYNWGYGHCNGGEKEQPGDDRFTSTTINMIANYFKPGPSSVDNGTTRRIAQPGARSDTDKGDWYVSGNYLDGQSDITADNWIGVLGSNYIKLSAPWPAMAINQESPQDAYSSVLDKVGCSFPIRDRVDADIIDDVRTGTAKYGDNGIIDVPSDVGGWPTLNSAPAPTDSDHDGMPDSWESANGMNPDLADNNGDIDGDGYTNLEEYLNSLVNSGPTETFSLSTSINGQGSISPAGGSYSEGSVVTLTASGDVGWQFDSWSGDASGSNNPVSITMDGDKSITATFVQVPTYSLTSSVTGQGSISPASGTYSQGDVVSLTATADAGWQFDSWSGDASGSTNPVSITMDGNKSVTANFSEITNPTTITIQENETGFCSVDGSIDNNNAGFTGDGFANTDNASGEGITWSVNIPTAGSYSIVLKYANGGSTDRTAQLMEDGSIIVSNVSMPSTGSWTSWSETPAINVNLSAGTKLIRLQATNSSGLANIDYITISGGSISGVECAGLKRVAMTTEVADNNKDINFYPVPVNDLLNIQFNRELTEAVDLYLYDMTGKIVRFTKAKGLSHTLDMSDLPNGLYTVRIFGESLNRVERIVKQ